MWTAIAKAVGLFAVTNIDDIIVLSLFFARGGKWPSTTRNIALGQYLGFGGILGVALLTTWGAGALLPQRAIPYFGLIPLVLGLKAAWEVVRGEENDDDEFDAGRQISVLTVAGVTFANGGDNIGVYVPVFLTMKPLSIAFFCAVFLILVGVLVWFAKFVATRPGINEWLERSEHILFPLVLIILGVVILVEGHAFGL